MESKRGQVALIIIITVMMVSALVLIYVFREKIGNAGSGNIPEINKINQEIEKCFEQRSIDAVFLVGLQGGHINLPEDYLTSGILNIAYGLKNQRNTLSTIENIENEIKEYIELTLPFCIGESEYQNIKLELGEATSKVKIKKNIVETSGSLKLSIVKAEERLTFDQNYEYEIEVSLNKIQEVANEIVNLHLRDPNHIDLTYLTSTDFDIVFSNFDENTLIYTITDNENKVEEIPYSFLMGVEI